MGPYIINCRFSWVAYFFYFYLFYVAVSFVCVSYALEFKDISVIFRFSGTDCSFFLTVSSFKLSVLTYYLVSKTLISRLKELKKYSSMKFRRLDKKMQPSMIQKSPSIFRNPWILAFHLTQQLNCNHPTSLIVTH